MIPARPLLALAILSGLAACSAAPPPAPAEEPLSPGIHGTAGVGFVTGQGLVTKTKLKLVLSAGTS